MTRDATRATVKGDFNDASYECQGVVTRLRRDGESFVMETADPEWAASRAKLGVSAGPPRYARFSVERLVGSHWLQECLYRDKTGRYSRLPVLYHITEGRWVQTNGAFLAPDTPDFWETCRGTTWNETCLFCHNTRPSKNPVRNSRGERIGYDTAVAELGISCEACHGPGGDHVRLNRNPARRLALRSEPGDPSIINPARLPGVRRDEVCARCHAALVPKPRAWDPVTHKEPFIAGLELTQFYSFFWSELEQAALATRGRQAERLSPGPTDGRFWPDGTPLTTALEFNGMALSACYQNGRSGLSCLSCHSMHADDPNYLLKPGMQTNEACYGCHAGYRDRLTEHTRHAAESPGSLCYNCHMPHQVYSLLTTHRSHRIQSPDVRENLAGKPNACSQCHLDKSLGWVQDQLGRWPNRRPAALSEDERSVSAALLLLARGDARSRVVMAGAFSNPAARQASGSDWFGPFLTRLIAVERYPAVRYLAHRGLRLAYGESAAGPFDYVALPGVRAVQIGKLRERFDSTPIGRPMPHLPLTSAGRPAEAVLERLLKSRIDPDLTINE
jgi:predicted CXXCH cytochrome family protein